jgi:hypothetical protein
MSTSSSLSLELMSEASISLAVGANPQPIPFDCENQRNAVHYGVLVLNRLSNGPNAITRTSSLTPSPATCS